MNLSSVSLQVAVHAATAGGNKLSMPWVVPRGFFRAAYFAHACSLGCNVHAALWHTHKKRVARAIESACRPCTGRATAQPATRPSIRVLRAALTSIAQHMNG